MLGILVLDTRSFKKFPPPHFSGPTSRAVPRLSPSDGEAATGHTVALPASMPMPRAEQPAATPVPLIHGIAGIAERA